MLFFYAVNHSFRVLKPNSKVCDFLTSIGRVRVRRGSDAIKIAFRRKLKPTDKVTYRVTCTLLKKNVSLSQAHAVNQPRRPRLLARAPLRLDPILRLQQSRLLHRILRPHQSRRRLRILPISRGFRKEAAPRQPIR